MRIPASDVERLVPGIEELRIENVDDYALEQAVDEGGDKALRTIDPDNAVRLAGTATLLGQETEVAVIAVLELVDGQVGSCRATSGWAAAATRSRSRRPCSGRSAAVHGAHRPRLAAAAGHADEAARSRMGRSRSAASPDDLTLGGAAVSTTG